MKTMLLTAASLIAVSVFGGWASAQDVPVQPHRVRKHHDPSLLPGAGPSGPRMSLPGGVNSSDKPGPSDKLSTAGDAAVEQGDWGKAKADYQQALYLWPDNTLALYGLAKCAENDGDMASAIGYYRTAIYSHDPNVYGTVPGDGYRTNDVGRMMEFVLLLSQNHQDVEAQKVYKRAAHVLNYQDSQFTGKPFLKVLLPEFGPGQIAYTPQRLQAMAHVGYAIVYATFDPKGRVQHLQQAVALAPNSAVAHFYRGQSLLGTQGHKREMLADFRMAAFYGDGATKAEADKVVKDFFIERDAKYEQDAEDLHQKQTVQKK